MGEVKRKAVERDELRGAAQQDASQIDSFPY